MKGRRLTLMERFDAWFSRASPVLGPRMHRTLYRASGGRLGTRKRGLAVGLLTTTGRRSGRARTTPLMCLRAEDHVLVAASNAGFAGPPHWLLNLQADPVGRLRLGRREQPVRARVLTTAERAEAWPQMVAFNPLVEEFQRHTSRPIPLVALEPLSG